MATEDIFSDKFIVAWDDSLNSLIIVHPRASIPGPVVQIRAATLSEMSFEQASSRKLQNPPNGSVHRNTPSKWTADVFVFTED